MTKDEALKLALEAFGEIEWSNNSQWQSDRAKVAIATLKEALANEALEKMAENARELGLDYEPAQEPVAWEQFYPEMGSPKLAYLSPTESSGNACYIPPQRTWVGLTLDERIELAQDVDWAIGAYCEYAEKIEAKLKAKNVL